MLGAQHQEQESLSSLQAYEERERQVHRLQADIRQLSAAVARLARVLNIGISTIDDLTTPSGVVNFLVRHGVKHSTAHSWRKALPLLDFYDALRFALNRTIEAGPRARGRKLAPCSFSGTLCPCDQFFTSLSGDELDYIERTEKSPDDASPGGQD